MPDLLAARSQMAMSLAFHIIFAAVGMAMPALMVAAEAMWLRTGKPVYKALAKRWAKGTAILFAIGAVSGTVLSFELGLLWPTFMQFAGPIVGMPFSLEGFAFFLEAIFLGIHLYGWDRIGRTAHLLAGVMVAISGTMSAIFVICANSWMNTPVGFEMVDGKVVSIDPWVAMFNPGALGQGIHMVFAAYAAVGFAVAAVHAWLLRRDKTNDFHRKALAIGLVFGTAFACLQPPTGHYLGQVVGEHQPIKLAAMEAHWETEAWAPFRIGGLVDEPGEATTYAIEIPGLLSFLTYDDPNAVVLGLKDVPPEDRPPVAITHYAFQIMVACGLGMIGVGLLGAALALRWRKLPDQDAYLPLVILAGPLGFIGIEAGWTVTEVGRQPWVIYGVMRTSEAVTPMPGLVIPFATFSLLYLLLAIGGIFLLRRQFSMSPYYPVEPRDEP